MTPYKYFIFSLRRLESSFYRHRLFFTYLVSDKLFSVSEYYNENCDCIFIFCLASFYTEYNYDHFLWNTGALILIEVPKLPQFHRVRLFGINEY